jgi:hypothetical protein
MTSILKKLGNIFSIPWYFIVFSSYPVLSLLSFNIGQVKVENMWRPLLVSITIGGIFFLIGWLLARDVYRAAFLPRFGWLCSFLWTYIFDAGPKVERDKLHAISTTAWLVLFVLFTVWATSALCSGTLSWC